LDVATLGIYGSNFQYSYFKTPTAGTINQVRFYDPGLGSLVLETAPVSLADFSIDRLLDPNYIVDIRKPNPQATEISIQKTVYTWNARSEGNSGVTEFVFPVYRTGNLGSQSQVSWTVTAIGSSPAEGSDFASGALPSGIVIFAAGESVKNIVISVAGDTAFEPNETFRVTLSSPVGATLTIDKSLGIIFNDDDQSPPLINSGLSSFIIAGRLAVGETLVALRLSDDPDGNGTDLIYNWEVSSDGQSWSPIGANSSSYIIDVRNAGSQIRLMVSYTDGKGFRELVELPAVTIPPRPTLAIGPLSADKAEGNSTATNFTFRVTRSGDLDAESTARWAVAGSGENPADAGDFLNGRFPSGTVRFLAGQSARNITVRIAGDNTFEPDETFTVSLSDPAGASINPEFSSATGTIRNDDAPPLPTLAIAATDANKPEGFSGNTPFTFTVTRTGDTTFASSASWEVSGIGANPADATDFARGVLPSGTVRFSAGQTSRTITVNVRADRDQEPDERFRVTLSNPTGATITTANATGIIRNDDLIGTAANDTIIGTSRPEFIDGLAGQDTLTGGAGPDVFGFRFGQSRIRTPDRITDFSFGEDTIALLNAQGQLRPAPVAFSRAANNSTADTLADLAAAVFADADGRTAGNQPLAANAAALVRSTNAAIAGTYLLINDANAGRSLTADLMVNITGFSGTLPALGVRPVQSVFG
jgi:hypothetical protein